MNNTQHPAILPCRNRNRNRTHPNLHPHLQHSSFNSNNHTTTQIPTKRGLRAPSFCSTSTSPSLDPPPSLQFGSSSDTGQPERDVYPGFKIRRVAAAVATQGGDNVGADVRHRDRYGWRDRDRDKTYAQRYRERVAVYRDAEGQIGGTRGEGKGKAEGTRLGSPFGLDVGTGPGTNGDCDGDVDAEGESECESERDIDSEGTEVEMNDINGSEDEGQDEEMVLLPGGYDGNKDKGGADKDKDKVWVKVMDRSCAVQIDRLKLRPQLQPQPRVTQVMAQPRHRTLPYKMTEHHSPLSNDAISSILRQCTPQSPRAQTWIAAHEANKAAQMAQAKVAYDRDKMRVRGRDGLRRQVLQLRPKSEWNIWRNRECLSTDGKRVIQGNEKQMDSDSADVKGHGQHNIPAAVSVGQRQGRVNMSMCGFKHRGTSYMLNDQDKRALGVLKSSARLQVATSGQQESEEISGRVKQELRAYFGLPRGQENKRSS